MTTVAKFLRLQTSANTRGLSRKVFAKGTSVWTSVDPRWRWKQTCWSLGVGTVVLGLYAGRRAHHDDQANVSDVPSMALCDGRSSADRLRETAEAAYLKQKRLDDILVGAAVVGQTEVVKKALEAGARADGARFLDDTALMFASEAGNVDMVRLLLGPGSIFRASKYADPDLTDEDGNTALMKACSNWRRIGTDEAAFVLLKAGANPNLQNEGGATALMKAGVKGRFYVVDALLRRSVSCSSWRSVDLQDENGRTALMWVCKHSKWSPPLEGHVEVVRRLLDKHADTDVIDKSGNSALMYARASGRTDIVKLLLEKGAK